MKNLFYLGLFVLSMTSCSVENEADTFDGVLEINLSFEDEICGEATFHRFGDLGNVTVFNDTENLIVRIISADPEGLIQARVAIVDDLEDFPVTGGGNLPPGQMPEVIHVGGDWFTQFTFPLSRFSDLDDNCLLIATWATFKGKGGGHWAGNQTAGNGKTPWRYFSFCIQGC